MPEDKKLTEIIAKHGIQNAAHILAEHIEKLEDGISNLEKCANLQTMKEIIHTREVIRTNAKNIEKLQTNFKKMDAVVLAAADVVMQIEPSSGKSVVSGTVNPSEWEKVNNGPGFVASTDSKDAIYHYNCIECGTGIDLGKTWIKKADIIKWLEEH